MDIRNGDILGWEGYFPSVILFPKIPRLTGRETQIGRHSTGQLVSTSQNYQGHKKQEKTKKLSQNTGHWGDATTKMTVGAWIGILEQKEDVNGKTGTFQIKSGVDVMVMF